MTEIFINNKKFYCGDIDPCCIERVCAIVFGTDGTKSDPIVLQFPHLAGTIIEYYLQNNYMRPPAIQKSKTTLTLSELGASPSASPSASSSASSSALYSYRLYTKM